MLGAIIGDIAGSIYEPKDSRIKTKDFPFFSDNCRFNRRLGLHGSRR